MKHLTLAVTTDIDLEHSNPIFSLDTSLPAYDDLPNQIEFGCNCKRLIGLELTKDILETVIFLLYKPTL